MKKPIIGISCSILVMESGRFPGYRKSYVNEDYVKAVLKAGGIPLLLPMIEDVDVIKENFEFLDALILSGGHDVSSLLYGEQPNRRLGETLPERDKFDLELIKRALEKDMPILGICRGMQIMNVALGGSLYQDLDYIPNCDLKHDQYSNPSLGTHEVSIKEGTSLHKIIKAEKTTTNSFHHLAVKDLGKGLIVSAKSSDGVVEAIEMEEKSHVIGVQWHPEMMAGSNDTMLSLFEDLVKNASFNR